MRQSEIKQDALAGRPKHDVAWFDVEVNHMLPMQVVQCGGDFQADVGNVRIGQWELGEPLE